LFPGYFASDAERFGGLFMRLFYTGFRKKQAGKYRLVDTTIIYHEVHTFLTGRQVASFPLSNEGKVSISCQGHRHIEV
jgi:hypothetical protein